MVPRRPQPNAISRTRFPLSRIVRKTFQRSVLWSCTSSASFRIVELSASMGDGSIFCTFRENMLSGHWDSNPESHEPEACILPLYYSPRTNHLSDVRSIFHPRHYP